MSRSYDEELKTAIDAVTNACALASKMQGTLEALDVVNKEDLSPVTITDFSCQALINMHVLNAFPHDEIMGEEDALFLRNPQNEKIKSKVVDQLKQFHPSIKEEEILNAIDKGGSLGGPEKRFWVLDPIDGTRGFIRNDQYCIALALIKNGEVVLGVLGCPRLAIKGTKEPGGIISAVKGHGAKLYPFATKEEKVLQVSQEISPGPLIYCEPHTSSSSHHHSAAFQVASTLHADPKPFRLDSQCKYAIVALGEAQIYLRIPASLSHREKIWDHAAGALIVEEAGGQVTDLFGDPLDFTHGKTLSANNGILATNGAVHDKVLKAIQKCKILK